MSTQQTNARLPGLTRDQITLISETYGLTKTQVLTLAVDRLSEAMNPENPDIKLLWRARTITDAQLGEMNPEELLSAYREAISERRAADVEVIRTMAFYLIGAHEWLHMLLAEQNS